MTTTPAPVPQWAVDAAKEHYAPIFSLFPDNTSDRDEPVNVLAAIIAKHAPPDADGRRLDWLEHRRVALNKHCGSNYGWKVIQSHLVNRLMLETPESGEMAGVDVNDSCVPSRDIRAAIDAAMKEGA